jgi:cysteine desulfurase/selenocysteine lyase
MKTKARTSRRARPLAAERTRKLFPILNKRVHRHPLAYLDAAATSQRPERVLEAMGDYYRTANGNTRQKGHQLGQSSERINEQSRKTVARYLNADSEEIVWVKGATEGINLVARAWGDERVGRGDNIVVSIVEHFSNLVPWQELA